MEQKPIRCFGCIYKSFEPPCSVCVDNSRKVFSSQVTIDGNMYIIPAPVADEIERLLKRVHELEFVLDIEDCTCSQDDREGESACPVCKGDNKTRYGNDIPVEGVE
jgi:hypothetical protein